MTNDRKEGQVEAHTPRAAAADPALDASGAGDPAHGLFDGRDVADLLTGSPDLAADDLLSMAAELTAGPRRGRGRPPGSPNRKNVEMIAYLQALGHRDPWLTLSLIQTADTKSLAMALRSPARNKNGSPVKDAQGQVVLQAEDLAGTLAMQIRAAEAIKRLHHSEMPVQLELPDGAGVPWMAIGEMTVNVMNGPLDGVMTAGEVIGGEKVNEINGSAVRLGNEPSHVNAKPLKTMDDPA